MASKFLWHILARFIRCYVLYSDACLPHAVLHTYVHTIHAHDWCLWRTLDNTEFRLIRCGWEKNQRVICILQIIIIAVNLQAKLSETLKPSRSIRFDNFFYSSHRMIAEIIPSSIFSPNLIKWIYSSWELNI